MGKIGKASALIFTLIIAMSCLTLLTVKPANAQPLWIELGVPTEAFDSSPNIQITSPNQNQTFASSNVSLNFSVYIPNSWVFHTGIVNDRFQTTWGNITSVSFSLDGNQPQDLTIENVNVPYLSNSTQNLNFSAPLNLTQETHSIQIFVSGHTYYALNPLDSEAFPLQLANVPVEANTTVDFYVTLPTTSPAHSVLELSAIAILLLALTLFLVALVLWHRKTSNLKQ